MWAPRARACFTRVITLIVEYDAFTPQSTTRSAPTICSESLPVIWPTVTRQPAYAVETQIERSSRLAPRAWKSGWPAKYWTCHRARVRKRKDRLGAVGGGDRAPAGGDRLDRVIPGHLHELARALGPDPPERAQDAERRVDALGVLAHFAADDALGEGMVGIAFHRGQPAVRDGHDEATARRAVVRTNGQHRCE